MTPEDAALLADLVRESKRKCPYFRTPVENCTLDSEGFVVTVEARKSGFHRQELQIAKPSAGFEISTDLRKAGHNSWKLLAIEELIRRGEVGQLHVCWPWPGPRTSDGYGLVILDAFHRFFAHRLSFELHKGKIPPAMEVMHNCDNPPCWNPRCLFLGTKSDNAQDAIRKGRR